MNSSNLIRDLRLSRAWSQEKLAELSALSVRTIQRIENGEQGSLETLSALAAVFGVNVAELSPAPDASSSNNEALDKRVYDARQRLAEENKFYRRLFAAVVVCVILFVVNRLTSPEQNWFIWPAIIWGLLLLIRGVRVFVLRDWLQRWQQARLQKILRK
ncbi:2TM domain-containing protein [Rouxiella sp. Mn2063]|uniref:2TM domain-containing protein n=1 Tax=Rouxiella sp. Mn2063 TaxID=3395262 RepID=UPI003BD25326